MDDRVDRRRRVQQLVARGRELAGDRGAQKAPGTGDVHPAEAQLVHRRIDGTDARITWASGAGDLDGRSAH